MSKNSAESDLLARLSDEKSHSAVPAESSKRLAGSLICRVTITNNTHPGDNIVIVAGGVHYFFRKGKSEMIGPYTLNLRGGQSYTFSSKSTDGCTIRYFAACVCSVDGNGQNVTFDWPAEDPNPPNLEPNRCLIESGFAIGVKGTSSSDGKIELQVTPLQ